VLTEGIEAKLRAFEALLLKLNRSHNLVARGDVEYFWERHIIHCLTINTRSFPEGAQVVDWGTGGGLPAVPLAIARPQLKITAVDSVQKKLWAVRRIKRELGLTNLHVWCGRASVWPGMATHSVSRATASLETLWRWHRRVAIGISATSENAWAPGLICLKGGDLSSEINTLHRACSDATSAVVPLDHHGRWFKGKVLVHVYQAIP